MRFDSDFMNFLLFIFKMKGIEQKCLIVNYQSFDIPTDNAG